MQLPRRILRHTLLAATGFSVVAGIAILALWGGSILDHTADWYFVLPDRLQFIVRDGRLSFFSDYEYDPSAKMVPEIVDFRTYRGEPAIGRCFAKSVGGFELNYCEFPSGSHDNWSVVLPNRPILAVLFVVGLVSHLLRRRLSEAALEVPETPRMVE